MPVSVFYFILYFNFFRTTLSCDCNIILTNAFKFLNNGSLLLKELIGFALELQSVLTDLNTIVYYPFS